MNANNNNGKILPMEKQSFVKFWMIIGAAFMFVGVIIAAWFFTSQATENEVIEKYNQQQYLLLEGTAVGIEGLFDDLSSNLSSLGKLPEIQYFDGPAARQELERKLEEMTAQGITDIGVLDDRGIARFFAVEKEAEGIDYSWRSYFRDAQQSQLGDDADKLNIELQALRPGELGFKIAIPIFETAVNIDHASPSGQFVGVIVGSLNFDTLIERHISPFKPAGGGQIFLVNEDFDVIWSTDDDMKRANILDSRQRAFADMADQMGIWEHGSSQGGFYTFEHLEGWNNTELIAFAQVNIGKRLMAVGVKTPDDVARQTSLSNFQSQQLVFILSILTILSGVLVGGFVLRRETRRRNQLEKSLKQSEVEQAIVSERNRLAGELHDSVTQGLYGIVLHADAAMGLITAGNTNQACEYLGEIKSASKEGLAEMRQLIFELRPPVLEAEGLAAALETRLYAVEKRAGLKTEIKSEISNRLPLEIEDGLYRIAQEVMNNALKHAQAQGIWVSLSQAEQMITLEIKDDGCGFDLASARKSGGMGLTSIEERAKRMNANMVIESHPGKGTCTTVEVKI